MLDAGIEFYKFADPKDGEWLINTAYDAGWKYQHDRFPEVTDSWKNSLGKNNRQSPCQSLPFPDIRGDKL